MLTVTRRGGYLIGAALAAVALLIASAAYACSNFKGTMTVTGGGGSTTVVGSGHGMTYCPGYPKDNAAPPAGGAHGTAGSTIGITVSPSVGCNNLKLPADYYDVSMAKGRAYTFTVDPATGRRKYSSIKLGCMARGGPVVALVPSTMRVPLSGSASGNFKLPAGLTKNGPSDASAVCVFQTNNDNGLQAPIIIT